MHSPSAHEQQKVFYEFYKFFAAKQELKSVSSLAKLSYGFWLALKSIKNGSIQSLLAYGLLWRWHSTNIIYSFSYLKVLSSIYLQWCRPYAAELPPTCDWLLYRHHCYRWHFHCRWHCSSVDIYCCHCVHRFSTISCSVRLHSIPSLNIRSDVDLGAAVPNADLFVLLVRRVASVVWVYVC